MKEKTAMMLAIEKIDFVIGLAEDAKNEMDMLHTLETLKKDFEELLPKEREQIIKAGDDICLFQTGEQYYTKTYDQ